MSSFYVHQPRLSTTHSVLLAGAALIGLGSIDLHAQTLTIGSPAPAIDAEHWYHDHEPVTSFEEGKVYVVEFWATWCGPCVSSMPHLAEIQKRYPEDLVVISVSSEAPAVIEEFLDKERGGMTHREITAAYRLATDPDRSVDEDYMKAAGRNGIPCAFVIGKTGLIEWIGHPMRMDDPVAQVIAGQWDRNAFAVELQEEKMAAERARRIWTLARQNKFPQALADLDALLAELKSDRVRQGMARARSQLQAQAATYAAVEQRKAEQAQRTDRDQARIVSRLLDLAFLLDDGKRDDAADVLASLLEETKSPRLKNLLEEALGRLARNVEQAAEAE